MSVAVSDIEGGSLPGLCRTQFDSRLRLDSNTLTNVNVWVSDNSVLYLRGSDPVQELEGWNFAKITMSAVAESISLGGFSRLLQDGSFLHVDTLTCDASSDAVCEAGTVLSSTCSSCPSAVKSGRYLPLEGGDLVPTSEPPSFDAPVNTLGSVDSSELGGPSAGRPSPRRVPAN